MPLLRNRVAIILKNLKIFITYRKNNINSRQIKKEIIMIRQETKTVLSKGGILKVWNDINGSIWYRYNLNKSNILTTFMIRMKKGRYVITPTENETYVLYRGTKNNCLVWASSYIEIMLNRVKNK